MYTVKQCDQKTPLKKFYNRQKYTSCSYVSFIGVLTVQIYLYMKEYVDTKWLKTLPCKKKMEKEH